MFAFLILFVVHVANCQTPEESYFIRSDQLRGFNSYEYSIYDAAGIILQYRIESTFHYSQSLEVVAYPSKKVVGKLRAKFRFLKSYFANFEVYDDRYRRWVKGVINETRRGEDKWKIQYDNHLLSVAHRDKGTTYFFEVEDNYTVMAQYEWKAAGFLEGMVRFRKFSLDVYSNEIPHIVYFLLIAVVDRNFYQGG